MLQRTVIGNRIFSWKGQGKSELESPLDKGSCEKIQIRPGVRGGARPYVSLPGVQDARQARIGGALVSCGIPSHSQPLSSFWRGEPRLSMSFNFFTAPGRDFRGVERENQPLSPRAQAGN